jgi:hypothetical protein
MQSLRDYALEVCTKAAQNIGGTIREVAKRTKSQAYLFGSLRRRYPEATEEELRATLHWLRHHAPDEDFTAEPRAPTKGREARSESVWAARAAQLAAEIECSAPDELLAIAKRRLGWSRNFTIQTLAAAEDAGLLTYEALCWARSDAVTRQAIKKIRIQRTLPCKLSPEQSHVAAQAAAAKLLERERLGTELKNLIREKRAEIANCQKEFIRLVVASGQAIEERDVECEQKTNYKLGVVEVTRLDTGEIIEARALRPDEKQLELGATG